MNAEPFQNAHRLRPFQPFAIQTASGESDRVAHPEAAWQSPGGQRVIIGTGGESVVMLDLSLVTEFVDRGNTKKAD